MMHQTSLLVLLSLSFGVVSGDEKARSWYTKQYTCEKTQTSGSWWGKSKSHSTVKKVVVDEHMGKNTPMDRSNRLHAHPCFPKCPLDKCGPKVGTLSDLLDLPDTCYKSCYPHSNECDFGKLVAVSEDDDPHYSGCSPLGQTFTYLGLDFALRPNSWIRWGWKMLMETGSKSEPMKLGIRANLDTRALVHFAGISVPFVGNVGGLDFAFDTKELQLIIELEFPSFENFNKAFTEGFDDVGVFVELRQDQDSDGVFDLLKQWNKTLGGNKEKQALLETSTRTRTLMREKLQFPKERDASGTKRAERCFMDKILASIDHPPALKFFLKYVHNLDFCAWSTITKKGDDDHITMGVQLKRPVVKVAGWTLVREDAIKLPNGGNFEVLQMTKGQGNDLVKCPKVLRDVEGGIFCPRGLEEVGAALQTALFGDVQKLLGVEDADGEGTVEAGLVDTGVGPAVHKHLSREEVEDALLKAYFPEEQPDLHNNMLQDIASKGAGAIVEDHHLQAKLSTASAKEHLPKRLANHLHKEHHFHGTLSTASATERPTRHLRGVSLIAVSRSVGKCMAWDEDEEDVNDDGFLRDAAKEFEEL